MCELYSKPVPYIFFMLYTICQLISIFMKSFRYFTKGLSNEPVLGATEKFADAWVGDTII